MSARTILSVVMAVGLLAVAYWIKSQNHVLLKQELVLFRMPGQSVPARLPVGHAFLFCFGLGAATVALSWTVRRAQAAFESMSARRAARVEREAEATYQRGLEAVVNGRPERALELMREVLARHPEHRGALSTGADVLRSLGRPAEAVQWRQRRLDLGEDVVALYGLAEDHRALADLGAAAATLERLLALRPKRGFAAARRLRDVLMDAGQWERAIAAHERLQKMQAPERPGETEDPDLFRAGLETRWGLQLAGEGRSREAVALLRKLLRRHPAYVPGHLALARAHLAEGREAEALQAWLDGYGRTGEASILVAAEEHYLSQLRRGDPMLRASAALGAFRRFAACAGSRPHATAFLGKLYTRFEMVDEAAAAFETVRAEFPDNPTFTYYAARIAEKQGRRDVAAVSYRGILKTLGVLALRFRCQDCSVETATYVDRCASCLGWGKLTLDMGISPPKELSPAPRPVYAVPEDGGEPTDDLG